jgi:hypothetical protein
MKVALISLLSLSLMSTGVLAGAPMPVTALAFSAGPPLA